MHRTPHRRFAPSRATALLAALLAVLVSTSGFAAGVAKDREAPLVRMKQLDGAVMKILKVPTKPGTPNHERKREALIRNMSQVFDFDGVAQRSLRGREWAKLTPAQQVRFTATLRRLIERTYLNKMIEQKSYNVAWPRHLMKDPGMAEVDADVKAAGKRVGITFVMEQGGPAGSKDAAATEAAASRTGWWVVDLVIEQVSLVENYRSQFNRILHKDGFEALMARMEEKLREAE